MLSFHARYACQHSGMCCTAHWPIPVEPDRLAVIRQAMSAGRLIPAVADAATLVYPDDAPPESPAVIGTSGTQCVFHDEPRARCRIHMALGHEALPLSCRQFPRVTVLDPAGAAVTLSHYCPTAAALLDSPIAISIVTAPLAFPSAGEYVGLDARDALPPLLAPDMLMDWPAWWAWESHAVALLGREDMPLDAALHTLAAVVELVRAWTPGRTPLADVVDRAFSSPDAASRPDAVPPPEHLLARVLEAVPADIRPATLERGPLPSEHARRRFLAAHAFGNWTGYLGLGLRSWLRSLHAADALLTTGLGVRHADLLLRHLADPRDLATAWSEAEG